MLTHAVAQEARAVGESPAVAVPGDAGPSAPASASGDDALRSVAETVASSMSPVATSLPELAKGGAAVAESMGSLTSEPERASSAEGRADDDASAKTGVDDALADGAAPVDDALAGRAEENREEAEAVAALTEAGSEASAPALAEDETMRQEAAALQEPAPSEAPGRSEAPAGAADRAQV
jgi:hypothetical protein